MLEFYIERRDHEIQTAGLAGNGLADLVTKLAPDDDESAARKLLERLAQRQSEKGHLEAGVGLTIGYWDVFPKQRGEHLYELFEWNAERTTLVPGVSTTLRYLHEQRALCHRVHAEFAPPLPKQMVAISKGVLEGLRPLEGVRYQSPPHMSGWYLTTDAYDGDANSLRVEHLYHVTAQSPELVRYLALPPGYCFVLYHNSDDVTFDEDVASETP